MNETKEFQPLADIELINPARDPKYSPNLYRWMRIRQRESALGDFLVFEDSQKNALVGQLFDGDLIGALLMRVLTYGTKAETYSYSSDSRWAALPLFWPEYVRIGRCALDAKHRVRFVGDGTRWMTTGEQRSCLWCGNCVQRLRTWVEPVQYQKWVAA